MTDDKIKITPYLRQIIHTKLTLFAISGHKECDLYYVIEVVQELRAAIGDEPLKEYYKLKYNKLIKYLNNLSVRLEEIKTYYDSINKYDEDKKERNLKRLFNDKLNTVPLINKHLFKCLYLLLDSTNLKYTEIPNERFLSMRKEYKNLKTKAEDVQKEEVEVT